MVLCKRHPSPATPALVFLAVLALPAAAQQPEEIKINVTATGTIDATGNGRIQWVMTFNPSRGYDRIKRHYPNLYVLFRDMGPERSRMEVNRETLKISSDDGQRSISFSADVLGAAVCRGNRWQVELAPSEQISTQDANRVFTVLHLGSASGLQMTIINTYLLPQNAQNIRFEKETRLLTYALPVAKIAGDPEVDVTVRYKKRLMAAVYKVYSDVEAQGGAYWAAKTIFKNTGKTPVFNLKIQYRCGEFSEMSVPEPYSVVPPGGAVVDSYFPLINSSVAQLRTPSPVQLHIRYEYTDAAGKPYSGETTRRLEMLGINQFEFSNLNDEDRSDNWFDYFNNAPLLAAFVTKVDEAVRQFAGYVSEAAGGAAANASKDDAVRWLKAAYTMQLLNNIVYQTPAGFMTKDRSGGQEIKYPRDVFRDKAGTCVDLAIAYAALAESVGLQSYLMLVPGHAFAVIRLPGGELLPVENTGLGGGDKRLSFEQAVEIGLKNMQKYVGEGLFYLINVQDQWTVGRVPNPELQALGIDFLEKAGIKRLAGLGAAEDPRGGGPGGQFRLIHDHGISDLSNFCIGTLRISGDVVTYQAERATDGRLDRFQVKKAEIREARQNRLGLGTAARGMTYQAFHIRLHSGINYNFAHIDPQGRDLGVAAVLMELNR
ncbi:MAG: hypothetical protein AAB225_15035 [Acidobacteriota bacterium]